MKFCNHEILAQSIFHDSKCCYGERKTKVYLVENQGLFSRPMLLCTIFFFAKMRQLVCFYFCDHKRAWRVKHGTCERGTHSPPQIF